MNTELAKVRAMAPLLPSKAQLAIVEHEHPAAVRAMAADIGNRVRRAAALYRTPMSALVERELASRSIRP